MLPQNDMSYQHFIFITILSLNNGSVELAKTFHLWQNLFVSLFTVKSLFVAVVPIKIGKFLAQNLLSKIWVLLRLLFKGGY